MKLTRMRMERKKLNMTIMKLSQLSGVSFEKTRQLDMGYRVETTSYEIKEKISKALNKDLFYIFADLKKHKKRISMSVLQALARKIESDFGILTKDGKLKLRHIIILHFDMLGYEIYYDK